MHNNSVWVPKCASSISMVFQRFRIASDISNFVLPENQLRAFAAAGFRARLLKRPRPRPLILGAMRAPRPSRGRRARRDTSNNCREAARNLCRYVLRCGYRLLSSEPQLLNLKIQPSALHETQEVAKNRPAASTTISGPIICECH